MMTGEKQDEGLPFRPDFAARVLDRADAISERRRRTRLAVAAVSVSILVGAAMFGVWQASPVPASGTERIPQEIAGIDLGALPASRSAQMEPLDFMFPDAAPLSQFSDRYAGADNADVVEDDLVFFPDVEEDVVVDGS